MLPLFGSEEQTNCKHNIKLHVILLTNGKNIGCFTIDVRVLMLKFYSAKGNKLKRDYLRSTTEQLQTTVVLASLCIYITVVSPQMKKFYCQSFTLQKEQIKTYIPMYTSLLEGATKEF